MTVRTSVLEMIGDTPLVELTRMNADPSRLFVKLENQNPGGSINPDISRGILVSLDLRSAGLI